MPDVTCLTHQAEPHGQHSPMTIQHQPGHQFQPKEGDVKCDEGLEPLRVLARNMSFLIKSIALGKEKFGLPAKEEHAWTNFI